MGTTGDFFVESLSVFIYFASRLIGQHPTPKDVKFRLAFGVEDQRSMEQQGGAEALSHTSAISK